MLEIVKPSVIGASVSLLAAGILSPFIFKGLQAMKSRQTIQKELEEHKQKQGTPTMGGLIILAGLLVGMAAVWRDSFLPPAILLLGFGVIGFFDDYLVPKMKPGSRGFDWKPKITLQFLTVGAAMFLSGRTDPVGIAVAIFVILFFSNAYNFSDGLDGLAGGLGLILCVGLGIFICLMNQASALVHIPILAILAMAYLPFLFYNAPPARVFMGDAGALPLGAIFGWIFLDLGTAPGGGINMETFVPLLLVSFMMFAELVPPPLQVASAKLRKGKRLFPFKTPIHHGFQSSGWPETRVVYFFHIVQIVSVVAGLVLLAFQKGLL